MGGQTEIERVRLASGPIPGYSETQGPAASPPPSGKATQGGGEKSVVMVCVSKSLPPPVLTCWDHTHVPSGESQPPTKKSHQVWAQFITIQF